MDDMENPIAQAVAVRGRGTKAKLAEAAEVGASTVTRWVRGDVMPDPSRWESVEDALELAPGTIESYVRKRAAVQGSSTHALLAEIEGLAGSLVRLRERVAALSDQFETHESRLVALERKHPARSHQRSPKEIGEQS